jgi:hypothetical protein
MDIEPRFRLLGQCVRLDEGTHYVGRLVVLDMQRVPHARAVPLPDGLSRLSQEFPA